MLHMRNYRRDTRKIADDEYWTFICDLDHKVPKDENESLVEVFAGHTNNYVVGFFVSSSKENADELFRDIPEWKKES